jgi:hypothetical protein
MYSKIKTPLFTDEDYEIAISELNNLSLVNLDLLMLSRKISFILLNQEEHKEQKIASTIDISKEKAYKLIQIINHEVAMAKVNSPNCYFSPLLLQEIICSVLYKLSVSPIDNLQSNLLWQETFEQVNNNF